MDLSPAAYLTMALSVIAIVGVVIGLIFLVRHFIKYNANMKKKKTQQQEELDRMRIDDL